MLERKVLDAMLDAGVKSALHEKSQISDEPYLGHWQFPSIFIFYARIGRTRLV